MNINTMRKKIGLCMLVCVAIAAVSIGGYYAWLITPPAMPETIDEATAMMKSARYERLSDAEQRPYRERIRELWGSLDRQERRELHRQVRDDKQLREASRDAMRQFMVDRARDFAKASQAEREAILDRFADRRGGRRARHGDHDRNENLSEEQKKQREERRETRRDQFKKRMKDHATTGNPQHGAYMGEFFKAIRNHRKSI